MAEKIRPKKARKLARDPRYMVDGVWLEVVTRVGEDEKAKRGRIGEDMVVHIQLDALYGGPCHP